MPKGKKKFYPHGNNLKGQKQRISGGRGPAKGRHVYIDHRHLLVNGPVLSWVQVRLSGAVTPISTSQANPILFQGGGGGNLASGHWGPTLTIMQSWFAAVKT